MVINLKKDKNVRTPPVIKEPRPLLTMGDVWNVAFVAVAFLLQKASGAILTFVKIPYNAVIVNVIDTLTGITYPAAILVGTIPAGHVPTDEEILNYTFRGSKRHMDKSTKVKDMQVALPFDRIIIDLGSKSMMLPVNDRFEIEYLS